MSQSVRSRSASQEIIDLHCENEKGQVRVIFPDRHIQVMAVEAAVRACGAYTKQAEFGLQFEELLQSLLIWCRERKSDISDSFITTRDGGLLFLAMKSGTGYNVSLEDALTELDTAIANDERYSLIRLSVLALPPCSKDELSSFLCREAQFRLWKNGE